ncbi:MAG: M23 family metallopeptidase [Cyanobacteria bacterium J06639_14]
MRFRLPRPYTVLITRTGEPPTSITFRPLPLIIGSLLLGAVPVVWIANLIYQNSELARRNENLTETAGEVLLELESLDQEIEDLQERAGLSEDNTASPQSQSGQSPQGGLALQISAEDLFSLAKTRMPKIDAHINRSIRPALEETLAAEAARAAAYPSASPLKGALDVSSEFGLRANPFGGRSYEVHSGIDFRGPIGMPVHATAEGVVVTAEYSGGYGNYIVIDHGYGHDTLYAHLSTRKVEVGERVKKGTLIGALGNTGRSSGPHLHYEIHRNGQAVNPRNYLQLEDPR